MGKRAPQPECGRQRRNPRQGWWVRRKNADSLSGARTSASRWKGRNAVRVEANRRRIFQRSAFSEPAESLSASGQVIECSPHAPGRKYCQGQVTVCLHNPRRPRIRSWQSSCAWRQRRPCPMTASHSQTGHCRGSHSASYSPGLHPVPEHGIKTITGSEGNRPGIVTRQGT